MGWLTSKWFPLPIKGLIFSVNDKNLVFNLSVEVDQCFCSFHDLGVGSIIQSISTIVPNVVQPIHYLPFAPRSRGIIKPFSFNKLSRTSRIHPAWQTRTPEKIQNSQTQLNLNLAVYTVTHRCQPSNQNVEEGGWQTCIYKGVHQWGGEKKGRSQGN